MKLYIKNMVCKRCVLTVENQLNELGLNPFYVSLGEVDFGNRELDSIEITKISERLDTVGFELLDTKASKLVDKTKRLILKYSNDLSQTQGKQNLSDFLKSELNFDYNYVSNLFSGMVGITMEKYLILLKIEKVKELLYYNELTLSEIAFSMGYSSVAHLSAQFKKTTGLTPTSFKKLKDATTRKSIDKLEII